MFTEVLRKLKSVVAAIRQDAARVDFSSAFTVEEHIVLNTLSANELVWVARWEEYTAIIEAFEAGRDANKAALLAACNALSPAVGQGDSLEPLVDTQEAPKSVSALDRSSVAYDGSPAAVCNPSAAQLDAYEPLDVAAVPVARKRSRKQSHASSPAISEGPMRVPSHPTTPIPVSQRRVNAVAGPSGLQAALSNAASAQSPHPQAQLPGPPQPSPAFYAGHRTSALPPAYYPPPVGYFGAYPASLAIPHGMPPPGLPMAEVAGPLLPVLNTGASSSAGQKRKRPGTAAEPPAKKQNRRDEGASEPSTNDGLVQCGWNGCPTLMPPKAVIQHVKDDHKGVVGADASGKLYCLRVDSETSEMCGAHIKGVGLKRHLEEVHFKATRARKVRKRAPRH